MPDPIPGAIQCECGAVKREANKWWLVFPMKDHIAIYPWPAQEVRLADLRPGLKIACGENCVLKAISRAMGEITK